MSNTKHLNSITIKLKKINDATLHLQFITVERDYITFDEFYKICTVGSKKSSTSQHYYDNLRLSGTQPKYQHIVNSLTKTLGNIPYPFYWECAPIKNVTDPVQIYLVKAQFNTRKADIHTFENQITAKNKNDLILHFPSNTGTSELIIPNPIIAPDNAIHYTHIRNFMRYGDEGTCLAFWSVCAQSAMKFLKKHGVVYLKTHGHAVNYVHFRLQKTNAYYVLKF